ncbi:MAG: TMEM43 family protein [Candidatus Edwardsbacteria bacterium]|nr:TMEM43 family protein [Candidatus Edwardsbacteria bacterium]
MTDQLTEVTTTGWGKRILNSFIGVLVGLALFLISFIVLWRTEGRTDFAKLAQKAVIASPSSIDQNAQEQLASVTGPLETVDLVGDPDFIAPGNYLILTRRAEMFAWRERVSTKTQKNTGGSETTTKTYSYEKEWTENPENSGDFKQPEGHANPPPEISSRTFTARQARAGVYELDMGRLNLPPTEPLDLGGGKILLEKTKGYSATEEYLFQGQGSLAQPQIGDTRLSFYALPSGRRATVFGKLSGGMLDPYFYNGEKSFYRAFLGNRDEAVAKLGLEYKTAGWIGRIIGFLMMWIGLLMLTGPLHTILDVLPFLGSASRLVIGLIAFPVALVLSAVTIVVSMIAHNIIVLLVVLALMAGLALFFKLKKKPPAPAIAK